MYMREMGNRDLLKREDEVEVAKQLVWVRQMMRATMHLPVIVEDVLRRIEQVDQSLPSPIWWMVCWKARSCEGHFRKKMSLWRTSAVWTMSLKKGDGQVA